MHKDSLHLKVSLPIAQADARISTLNALEAAIFKLGLEVLRREEVACSAILSTVQPVPDPLLASEP